MHTIRRNKYIACRDEINKSYINLEQNQIGQLLNERDYFFRSAIKLFCTNRI